MVRSPASMTPLKSAKKRRHSAPSGARRTRPRKTPGAKCLPAARMSATTAALSERRRGDRHVAGIHRHGAVYQCAVTAVAHLEVDGRDDRLEHLPAVDEIGIDQHLTTEVAGRRERQVDGGARHRLAPRVIDGVPGMMVRRSLRARSHSRTDRRRESRGPLPGSAPRWPRTARCRRVGDCRGRTYRPRSTRCGKTASAPGTGPAPRAAPSSRPRGGCRRSGPAGSGRRSGRR